MTRSMYFNPCVPTEIAQAMISLVEDETALRGKLIEAGSARASAFSDSQGMARSYWEVFQHAVDNPGDARESADRRLQGRLVGTQSDDDPGCSGRSGPARWRSKLPLGMAPGHAG